MSYRIIVATAIILVLAATVAGKEYRFPYQKMVPVESRVELTINNANGDITLTASKDKVIRVDAVKNIITESKEEAETIAEHIQIAVSEADGHFTVEPRFLAMPDRSPSFWQKLFGQSGETSYGSVNLEISVPADCNAEIFNTSGNVTVSGIMGRIFISGTAGDVAVRDHQGTIEVATTSGQITLNDIEGATRINANGSDITFYALTGDLEIRNSTGQVQGDYLVGDLSVTQATGNIRLEHLEGDVRVKSTSGKIELGQDFGALDISTESGDIAIKTELNSPKDYFVETISGSIRFMIPGASSGMVKLEAGSGNIDTKVPIAIDSFSRTRLTGSFGHGGPKISLATVSGDIELVEF